jgi:hypothetical protein
VKQRLEVLKKRFGVRTRAALVSRAIDLGLIMSRHVLGDPPGHKE